MFLQRYEKNTQIPQEKSQNNALCINIFKKILPFQKKCVYLRIFRRCVQFWRTVRADLKVKSKKKNLTIFEKLCIFAFCKTVKQ